MVLFEASEMRHHPHYKLRHVPVIKKLKVFIFETIGPSSSAAIIKSNGLWHPHLDGNEPCYNFSIYPLIFTAVGRDFHFKISELGSGKSVEPVDSLGHLQIKDLPELSSYPQFTNKNKFYNSRSGNSSHFM